jgi:putative ABC transport system ATP-binding protein
MKIIEVENLRKEYEGEGIITKALDGVSFSIDEGEFVAIMGPSGSGKSTLLHNLALLDKPTSGTYKFDGKPVENLTDEEKARLRNKKMGFIFQSYNLLPRTTVFDNVKLPLLYAGLKEENENDLVRESLRAVGLENKIFNYPSQLSGGEQQRAAIARALVNRPLIIFADEPTGNLDSKSGQKILEIFQDLNEKGHTIILITHEKYTAETSQRIILIKDGKVESDAKVVNRVIAKNGLIK